MIFRDKQGLQGVKYDKLVLATGASQVSLGISGSDLRGIYRIKNLNEALEVNQRLDLNNVKNVAIIGGGSKNVASM